MENVQVEVSGQAEEKRHGTSSEVRDKSGRKDKSTQQEKCNKTESNSPPIEFEDQMYELMQEAEMEE